MNPALALLFSLIGIDVEKDKDIDAAALHSLLTTKDANTAITVLKAKLDKLGESDTQIAALKAKLTTAEKGVNLSTHVPIETYNAVIEEMASLKADHGTVTVAQVIEQAQTDGKFIAAAEVDYLTKLGNTDIAALKANIDLRPTVGAFQGKQTKDQKNPGKSNENDMAALSGADDAVRKQMGLSVEQFKAARTV